MQDSFQIDKSFKNSTERGKVVANRIRVKSGKLSGFFTVVYVVGAVSIIMLPVIVSILMMLVK